MLQENPCSGVIVPMVTPFNEMGEVDASAVHTLTRYLIENNAAPFVLGTTGESASLSSFQRRNLVKNMVDEANRDSLTYAGISSNSLETSLEMARQYVDLGTNVLVAHPPCYYPVDDRMMLTYFEKLADRLPEPLILYNIPQVTHCSLSIEVIDRLSHHPNIVGIKDSERDMTRLEECLRRWINRSDFAHVVGWGSQMAFGLQHGSAGIVPSSGNISPTLYVDLYHAAIEQNIGELNRLQEQANLISAVYQKNRTLGASLAALKVMLHQLGLCEPHVLPPLLRLLPEEEGAVIAEMQQVDVLKNLLTRKEV